MKKIFLIPVFLMCAVLALGTASFAQDTAAPTDLDQVIKNQEQILRELAEIKKELYVVKIRASN